MSKNHWILSAILVCTGISAALEKNILIHTCNGLVSIQDLSRSQQVISSEHTVAYVINKKSKLSTNLYAIELDAETIYCSSDQLFYEPQLKQWMAAQNLSSDNVLLDINGNRVECLRTYHYDTHHALVYEISLTPPHTFYAGKAGILIHNAFFFATPAIPITISTACKIGALIAAGLSYLKFNKDKKRQIVSNAKKATFYPPNDPNDDNQKKHPNGKYKDAPYHHQNSSGYKSNAPKNGQKALNNSIRISSNSTRRVGISEGEIVILDKTSSGVFHGHVRTWKELQNSKKIGHRIMRLLIKNNLVNRHGKIL